MKKYKIVLALSSILLIFAGLYAALEVEAVRDFLRLNDDPDMPGFLEKAKSGIDKQEFMHLRSEQIAYYRGMKDGDPVENIKTRNQAIDKMIEQEAALQAKPLTPGNSALLAAWTPIGPNPIPNGQTTPSTPVSGRVTTIAVHPTDPNIVYIGTAQGGVYRTLDGGVNWTAIMDNANSLAIGAVRIAPSQPDTIYVGTGEPNFCADCYDGVGVYRIDNASTAPVVSGPFNKDAGNVDVFFGRSIGEIVVHPTNPDIIFVASASAAAGINGSAPVPTLGNRGVWRTTTATSAAPVFQQIGVLAAPNNNFSVRDIEMDPLDPNIMVANLVVGNGGIYRTTNALAPTPTWTNVFTMVNGTGGTNNTDAEFAVVHPAGDANATFYAGTGNNTAGTGNGRLLKSVNGGVTWTAPGGGNNFCSGQCFYDIGVAVDPTNVNNVYLAGSPTLPFGFSINGGTSFTTVSAGIHADSHAIAVAPSNPTIIYLGTDGGIYRSITSGTAFTQMNTAGLLATQFVSLDTHPTDPNITIGGTQDNGTNRFTDAATWIRTDFGDGGYAVIDQSSPSTVLFNQYHTYFNASNLTAYAFTSNPAALEGTWTVRGCNGGAAANGITCTSVINFYAPLERGPGTPNSIYYGSDRLYRSVDTGVTNTTESQTFTSPLSAIGISPQNDNVRIIGLNDGRIFGTTTGANPLIDLDPSNAVPAAYISRAVISPNDANTAYVTLTVFNAPQIYRTTNLSSFAEQGLVAPTWTPISGAATGLPLVPVNAFLVGNADFVLYAGTDIGVYASVNGGATWSPLGTGLPRVAIFDMAFAPGNILRVATHGKGMYQITALTPTAASVTISGRVRDAKGAGIARASVTLTLADGTLRTAKTNTFGNYQFTGIGSGQNITLQASAKGYTFQPRVLSLTDDIGDLDFVPE
jgi:hypothetical protein